MLVEVSVADEVVLLEELLVALAQRGRGETSRLLLLRPARRRTAQRATIVARRQLVVSLDPRARARARTPFYR